jgi:hypothetical protein
VSPACCFSARDARAEGRAFPPSRITGKELFVLKKAVVWAVAGLFVVAAVPAVSSAKTHRAASAHGAAVPHVAGTKAHVRKHVAKKATSLARTSAKKHKTLAVSKRHHKKLRAKHHTARKLTSHQAAKAM